MSRPADRRGFLRGLVSLPLIGGGVTLIGQPTAAAAPVTEALMRRYVSFLSWDHRNALAELERMKIEKKNVEWATRGRTTYPDYPAQAVADVLERPHLYWWPQDEGVEAAVAGSPPQARAAVVLAAIGADWRGGPLHG